MTEKVVRVNDFAELHERAGQATRQRQRKPILRRGRRAKLGQCIGKRQIAEFQEWPQLATTGTAGPHRGTDFARSGSLFRYDATSIRPEFYGRSRKSSSRGTGRSRWVMSALSAANVRLVVNLTV